MNFRPQKLDQFIGQEDGIKPILRKAIERAKQGKLLPSMLLFGSGGTGKTTLSKVLANEANYEYVNITAARDTTPQKLRYMLLSLDIRGYKPNGLWQKGAKKYVFFIDEAHVLATNTYESVLYSSIEDLELHLANVTHWLPDITFILATTSPNVLPFPLLTRLPLQLHLTPYGNEDITTIILKSYPKMPLDMAKEVANRSRGIPRLALSYACQVELCDYSLTALDLMGVDQEGLTELDRSYLAALAKGDGKGMSISTLSSMVREDPKVLVSMVEPYLLFLGKVQIGNHGRLLAESSSGRGEKAK